MAFSHAWHKAVITDFLDALDTGRQPRVTARGFCVGPVSGAWFVPSRKKTRTRRDLPGIQRAGRPASSEFFLGTSRIPRFCGWERHAGGPPCRTRTPISPSASKKNTCWSTVTAWRWPKRPKA